MSAREKRLPVHFSPRLDAEAIEDGNQLPRLSAGVPGGTLQKLMHRWRATEGLYRLPAGFVFELVEKRLSVYFFSRVLLSMHLAGLKYEWDR